MSEPAPFAEVRSHVHDDWVDHNGHMGVRSYMQVFDPGVHHFYRHCGLTREALEAGGGTIFALQESAWYRREVMRGDPLLVVSQLIEIDHSKLVTFHTLRQTRDDYVAALYEVIEIHIDRESRRPAPFPAAIRARLEEVMSAHAGRERPAESGRGIAIPRKSR